MAAGRPKKYTKKGLREAIERYFRSISRTIPARDDTGGIIRNDDGEEIKVVQFVVPPSVTGMCLYLGIDRSTWQNYADAALHPELAGICQGARTRIEAYLEQELLTREKGVQGIIFNLQNYFGWKQKQEGELGMDTRESMKHAATYRQLRPLYEEYRQSRDKEKFLRGHEGEIILFEAAARELKRLDAVPLPATQRLRAEMDELTARKAALQSEHRKAQREERQYDTLRQNVEALLEKPREAEPQRQRNNELE